MHAILFLQLDVSGGSDNLFVRRPVYFGWSLSFMGLVSDVVWSLGSVDLSATSFVARPLMSERMLVPLS